MNKPKKIKEQIQKPEETPIIRLVLLITLIYFVVVLGVIYCVRTFDLKLLDGSTKLPQQWVWLIYFVYYVLPFVFASFFGVMFKPFWPNFRNIIVSIFMIHFAYSFVTYSMLHEYKIRWYKETRGVEGGLFKVNSFNHKLYDENQDGRIDRIQFLSQFDVGQLSDGDYIFDILLSQRGKPLPHSLIGQHQLTVHRTPPTTTKVIDKQVQHNAQGYQETSKSITRGKNIFKRASDPKVIRPIFDLMLDRIDQYFQRGPIDVDIDLKRIIRVEQEAYDVLFFNRWNAFLRTTTWEGYDQDIVDDEILVQSYKKVDTFNVIPIDIRRKQVFFREYIGDYGVDNDGDGLYESLVVAMKIHSNYTGDIYLSGNIEGTTSTEVQHKTTLNRGLNKVDFVIPAKIIKTAGFDGPYEITNFEFTNDDPSCKGQACEKRLKASFREYLEDYVTQIFTTDQFE